MVKLIGAAMETDALLKVTPQEIAEALLMRRRVLQDQLPIIVKRLDGDGEAIAPKVIKNKEKNDKIKDEIAKYKNTRDTFQKEAREILNDIKEIQEELTKSGNMVNLDPKWKKERMWEELEDIEFKIQTVALDQNAEKKMISARKRILQQNEEWLKERKNSNPGMATYIEKRKKVNLLYKSADKAHSEMIKRVQKGEPIHAKYILLREEFIDINRQKDRAKELLTKSERDILYWENVILSGYDELLKSNKKVEAGGASTFVSKKKKIKKINKIISKKEVEEE
ncbi:MAG: hypothetical protein ACKVI6_05325 [Candidatus Poseidoniales archaeon]|jgi:uncharacterized coiled-coil DUF342 family protein|tara:strand:- start:761 stop:1606 length:846 start_codon:yes stop_codon:yes gene_type:complete